MNHSEPYLTWLSKSQRVDAGMLAQLASFRFIRLFNSLFILSSSFLCVKNSFLGRSVISGCHSLGCEPNNF